ncbi:MAG: hypothetical protein MUD12_15170 [Spirochaetes bacterium]|jgi:hypothetical protein|nr:hypothetical protein [Spirochaetota bacterium]
MKKALVGALLIGMSLFSCYDSTANFARVLLLIGGAPSNTTKLHVAAYAGFVSDATLIMTQSYEPTSIIALIIPNARILTFVVWVEETVLGTQNTVAGHVGVSFPVIISGEGFATVAMEMQKISSTTMPPPNNNANAFFNINYTAQTGDVVWTGVPGANKYELEYWGGNMWIDISNPVLNIYHNGSLPTQPWHVRACSSTFNNVCTEWGESSW